MNATHFLFYDFMIKKTLKYLNSVLKTKIGVNHVSKTIRKNKKKASLYH